MRHLLLQVPHCFGAAVLLRFPAAATHSGRSSRHRRRSPRFPESNLRFDSVAIAKAGPRWGPAFVGAADRNRTGTVFTPRDFKSLVSTYSTTTAYSFQFLQRLRFARILSPLCLPVGVPDIFLAVKRRRQLSTPATRSPSSLCHRQRSARSPIPPFVVPGSLLAANCCVAYRPRHTLRPRCICHWQRSGSRPQRLMCPLVLVDKRYPITYFCARQGLPQT